MGVIRIEGIYRLRYQCKKKEPDETFSDFISSFHRIETGNIPSLAPEYYSIETLLILTIYFVY